MLAGHQVVHLDACPEVGDLPPPRVRRRKGREKRKREEWEEEEGRKEEEGRRGSRVERERERRGEEKNRQKQKGEWKRVGGGEDRLVPGAPCSGAGPPGTPQLGKEGHRS